MSRAIAFLIVSMLVTFGLATALAAPGGGPATGKGAAGLRGHDGGPVCLPGEAFENDDVRIWFQGLKGHLKVFDKRDDGNTMVYDFQTVGVDELDGDASLAHLDLDRAYPHHSGCIVEETEEHVDVTYTVAFGVSGTDGGSVGEANVTFEWHYNKSAAGAKFDLNVEDWPWQGDGTELAFDFRVTSAYTIEVAENGIGFRNETDSRGYIEWAPNATAYYADGHSETAIVDSETDADAHHATVRLRFTNVTSGYDELDYDPWIGVGDYVIIGGVLVGLGALTPLLPTPLRPLVQTVGRLL